ncbi:crossover junction endonuclease EME1-like isoform X1 [Asterias rubens]|uniref:crossover junction endonuclease EME1-like isoform X1 n=1 Tax=Asterias rubens TaxID=7604 RepID=UPI0014558A1B|nr:crossover junction endonuclease EME1-like isoform X1 [Asterias rubens]
MICPDISRDEIQRDLLVTGDPQETINRIFEGSFLFGTSASLHPIEASRSPNTRETFPTTSTSSNQEETQSRRGHTQSDTRVDVISIDVDADDRGDGLAENKGHYQCQSAPVDDDDSDLDDLPDVGIHLSFRRQSGTSFEKEFLSTSGGHQDLQPTGASSFQSAVDNVVIIDESLNLLPHTGSPREPCVDLTLSPQEAGSAVVDFECLHPAEDIGSTSPVSLPSSENIETTSGDYCKSPIVDLTDQASPHVLEEESESVLNFRVQDQNSEFIAPVGSPTGDHNSEEFVGEEAALSPRSPRHLDPVDPPLQDLSSDDDNIMDRFTPMAISSSDDEEEGVTLSLLHRIRSKQLNINRGNHPPHKLSNQTRDEKAHDGVSRKHMSDLSNTKPLKPAIVSASANHRQKKYHEISDDEDDDSMKTASYGTSASFQGDSDGYSRQESSHSSCVRESSQEDLVPSKKKARRCPEEIATAKQKALEKRALKEQEKQLKMRQQDEKKQLKMREAQVQKALREAHKSERPEECMKYVTVVTNPLLLEDTGGGILLTKLQALESRMAIESQPIPGSVTWRRQVMEHNLGDDLQLNTLHQKKEECEAIVLLPVASFVDMVYIFKQEQQGVFTLQGPDSLKTYANDVQQTLNGKAVTFIIQGMEKYFRLQKNSKQRNFRSAVLGSDPPVNTAKTRRKKRPIEDITTNVTRVDMEEALVDLQLHVGCNVRFVETPTEVADIVAMFTKSVAETPFKRERDKATFSFHVDTEWAGGVKVSKDGKGLLKVWRQQLQQFRNVSPEISSSIIALYPSPRLLLQAYSQCDTCQEARKLLQDIVIRRGEGVLATTRRVGPELSKRVHTLMTSNDPDLAL